MIHREQEQARWASREAELLRQKEASTVSSGSTSPKEKPPYPLHSPWKVRTLTHRILFHFDC